MQIVQKQPQWVEAEMTKSLLGLPPELHQAHSGFWAPEPIFHNCVLQNATTVPSHREEHRPDTQQGLPWEFILNRNNLE